MNPAVGPDLGGFDQAGQWIGLFVSLGLFSLIWRQHLVARILQYVLIGAASGWLVVLVWTVLIQPRIVFPIMVGQVPGHVVGSLVLFLVMALSIVLPLSPATKEPMNRFNGLNQVLKTTSSLVATAILAFVSATIVGGMLTGTLIPQISFAPQSGWWLLASTLLTGLVLVTCASSVLRNGASVTGLKNTVESFAALGRPILLLVAGMVFARMMSSRMTLVGSFLANVFETLETLYHNIGLDRFGG